MEEIVDLNRKYLVKNKELNEKGKRKIEWAENHMPVLVRIREKFSSKKFLNGYRISASLHVTKETAVLVKTLKALGANVCLVPSNPLSTQDDVAAALADMDINIFAWRGMTRNEYYMAILRAVAFNPSLTMDDGADLTSTIHNIYYGNIMEIKDLIKKFPSKFFNKDLFAKIIGGTEETTTGVIRIRSLVEEKKLLYPIIAVNDSHTKYLFDNRYGTGQSALDGIIRATNIMFAGKNVVVAGYGWVGRGIALRAKGLGANVIITEVDPIRALEAVFDGYRVMTMKKASKIGDIFITATGDINVIGKKHFLNMKNGAILANAGHFNVEINLGELKEISIARRKIRENVEEYILKNGRKIYLLAEGRLVNLAIGEGHPSEVMDMSFSNQVLALKYLIENRGKLTPKVYTLPMKIDREIARMKLESMGISIDRLSREQREYMFSWRKGT
ncbi:MAG: adenosylhomocysteinase [Thermoprotei archaeon]|nr:MAG: adenosylhomocysteinase [Thermoprotei archaeon]